MKNLFFLFVIMLACINVSSFGQTIRDEITVDGFEGNKPLKENQTVIVDYPEKWMKGVMEDAYKGETRKSFLERIKKQSEEAKKSLIAEKALEKEHTALSVEPYNKSHTSTTSKSKREPLSLQEFSDSLMMSENNHEVDSKTSSIDTSLDTKKEQGMTQARAQMIIFFIFCIVVLLFLFSKIPLLWRRKK